MAFNCNIILEILRSSFAKEIETFIEQYVMKLDVLMRENILVES